MRVCAKSYINQCASKSRLFRSIYIRCTTACRVVNRESREQRTHIDHVSARVCTRVCMRVHVRALVCARIIRGFSPVSELSANGEQFGMRVRYGRRWARRAVPFTCSYRLYDVARRHGAPKCVRAYVRRLIRLLRDLSGLQWLYDCVLMNLTRTGHERWYIRASVFAKLRWHTQIPNWLTGIRATRSPYRYNT